MTHSHFDDKSPLAHVVEKKAAGLLALSESHGMEMPGHLCAGADAMRETALLMLLLWTPLYYLHVPFVVMTSLLLVFGTGLLVWKTGRSAWLGWSRLERLHRLIMQERYEIEHNRPQEREELRDLYAAKGLEGKLLEDVLDVLMADNDRLLKIMLEEELGLTLQAHEHPLKQAFGAFLGTIISLLTLAVFFLFLPYAGFFLASAILIILGAVISSVYEKNRVLAAIVWNLAFAACAFGCSYFLLGFFL